MTKHQSKIVYKNIKKYLGEEWLIDQLSEIEIGSWIREDIPISRRLDYLKVYKSYVHTAFLEIENLIGRLKHLQGFSQWAKEARTDPAFPNYLFELTCIESLNRRASEITLKVKNQERVPEGFVKSQGEEFFIEMHNIARMSGNPIFKARRLFKKARTKFRGTRGILFIGSNAFNFMFDSRQKPIVPDNFQQLGSEFERQYNDGRNKNILAIIFVYSQWRVDAYGHSATDKWYFIIRNPRIRTPKYLVFLSRLLDVKDVSGRPY